MDMELYVRLKEEAVDKARRDLSQAEIDLFKAHLEVGRVDPCQVLEETEKALVIAGHKVQACKSIRGRMGCSLMQAKLLADAYGNKEVYHV